MLRPFSVVVDSPSFTLHLPFFFDSTGMNGPNALAGVAASPGAPVAGWHSYLPRFSHVYRLFRLHRGVGADVRGPDGRLRRAYRPTYIAGIGTRMGGRDSTRGQLFGIGSTGVDARVGEALAALRAQLDDALWLPRAVQVHIDVFGFSRGAFAARIFANRLRAAADLPYRVRFLGLFDTVGSLGKPGDNRNYGYDASCGPETAARIVHFTADQEFRANFPLSRAGQGAHILELGTPGSHCDIGGGWDLTAATVEQHTFQRRNTAQLSVREAAQLSVREAAMHAHGFFTGANTRHDPPAPSGGGWQGQGQTARYTRTVQPGLELATLSAMHHHASAAGVALSGLHQIEKALPTPTPPQALRPIITALKHGHPPPAGPAKALVGTHAHWSADEGHMASTHDLKRTTYTPSESEQDQGLERVASNLDR